MHCRSDDGYQRLVDPQPFPANYRVLPLEDAMQFVNPKLTEFVADVERLEGKEYTSWASSVHTTITMSDAGQITKEGRNGTLRIVWHTQESGNVSVLVCLIDANGDIQT